ncbi:MAG: neutral zinc metallopeptidase [Cyanobacteria bacterium P01_F01_bin.150]
MRWQLGRRSTNVEDRRGGGGAPMVVGGGLGTIVLAVVIMLLGGDPTVILDQNISTGSGPSANGQLSQGQSDQLAEFVSVVLADTEDTWHQIYRENGAVYQEPRLVLFDGIVQSACGQAQSAMGPFYCPADQKVYIDLSFYNDLRDRHGAPGDFAQAYVIAHEVGHHVQNLMGTSGEVQRVKRQVSQTQANQLSVRLELQADCYAGVWANRAQKARNILEAGDIEEALVAASAIGDDRLQSQFQGRVVPDSFTHGSSEQRVRWFTQGIRTGDVSQCDTFAVANP